MAYYTGTANNMGAVRQALIDACVLEGWSWDGSNEVLSKSTMFVQLRVESGFLRLLGRTSATGGDAPHRQQIGPFTGYAASIPAFTYPLTYEIFVFAGEVYCVINYSVDLYQWCAFGLSTVNSLPGTGAWVGASGWGDSSSYYSGLKIYSDGDSESLSYVCPALFWRNGGSSPGAQTESLVHSNLDGGGWWWGETYTTGPVGILATVPLIRIMPNAWNSEAVLLPIRAYKRRPAGKISLTADLEHARYTRVDNYEPGDVVTIGTERWKVFPWFRKNSAFPTGGYGHSGCLGWAIRYEGP